MIYSQGALRVSPAAIVSGSLTLTAMSRGRRAYLLCAAILIFSSAASADHHLVKRALQEARCLPASLREVSRPGPNLVLEARCKGRGDRRITLLCTPARCVMDDHGSHAPDQDEDSP